MKSTPASDGVWRRLVARPLWERKAAGSNPATPTRQRSLRRCVAGKPDAGSRSGRAEERGATATAAPATPTDRQPPVPTPGHRAATAARRSRARWPEARVAPGAGSSSDEVGAELGDPPAGGQALGLEP